MTLEEYQRKAYRTLGDSGLAILGLGIAGEAGEVADLIKKHLGHGHELNKLKLTKEPGDVLWYVAMIAITQGISLDEVGDTNILKLLVRYPDKFSHEASVNRKDNE